MKPGVDTWLASLLMGLAVGWGYFALRGYFTGALDAVERDLAEKLRRLRASTRGLRRWIVFWLATVAGVFFTFWLLLDNLVFGALSAAFLMAGPWWLIRRMAERRRRRIEDQLADAMVTLANAVRAGLSLAQAMEILASQCPKPLSEEFRQIVAEYNLGKPLEQTLREAKARLKSENFALFAAAILASHESGGRLNETVERIASSVLEMQRLERKVQSETAQARKSALYMALAPALILLVYHFIDPANTRLLFTTVPGQLLLAVAVVLNVIAYLWAKVILRPDL
ncbi:MAG: type II secretion system F family protein [Patescibacteria group bacterium]|nr:type II secretion system F family protein [Patescibacteria group bacterium]